MTGSPVSVIMPAWNAEAYVEAAIRSLLDEPGLALDVIVIDDASTDTTRDIVIRLAARHSNVRLIAAPKGGVSRARNVGLAALPGDCRFVGFLDADDLNFPGRIARQMAHLQRNDALRWVIGLIEFFERVKEGAYRPAAGSRTATIRGVQLGAALFDRRVFDAIGVFAEDMAHAEDTDFFLRLLESGLPYASEDEVAVLYRRHNANVTNTTLDVRRGFADALRRSLARRRRGGGIGDVGEFFRQRGAVEERFGNG
jgi:glycosyltransferase involved in cell wall biosynthesis